MPKKKRQDFTDFRRGNVVFSDDVRLEVDGKISIIGAYGSHMFVREFPSVMPKLALIIRYLQPIDEVREVLTIRATYEKDGEPVDRADVLFETQADLRDVPDADIRPDSTVLLAGINWIISPMSLPCTGKIRVRGYISGEEVKLGSLFIEKAPESEPAEQ